MFSSKPIQIRSIWALTKSSQHTDFSKCCTTMSEFGAPGLIYNVLQNTGLQNKTIANVLE